MSYKWDRKSSKLIPICSTSQIFRQYRIRPCHYSDALRLSLQLKERLTKRPHKLAVSAVSVAGQLAELAALGPA